MKTVSIPTFVIFALSSSFGLADIADQQSLKLFCYDSPAEATWSNALPATFEGAVRGRNLHHEVDEHGQGIIWGWAHWIKVDDPPIATEGASLDSAFKFDATAHLVVFREFWTYDQDSTGKLQKKDWVRRTVCHITAEAPTGKTPSLQVAAERDRSGHLRVVGFDAAAHSNKTGAEAIRWDGRTIGWVSVAWSAQQDLLRTDYRWYDPSENSALAANTQNALRLKRPLYVAPRGGLDLSWAFVLSESPIERKSGFEPPAEQRVFVLPPFESGPNEQTQQGVGEGRD
jgi:hypothetical protein